MKKNNKHFLRGILAAAAMLLVISCDDDYKEGVAGEAQLINDVNINMPSVFKLATGMDFQAIYSIVPEDAIDQKLVWKSSNENIATVTQEGYIQAKALGDTYINITPSTTFNAVKTIFLTVVPKATSIDMAPIEMYDGTSLTLNSNLSVQPENGYKEEVTCEVADKSVAIFENGQLKALKAGTTTITVKTVDGSNLSVTVTVTVIAAIEVEDVEFATNQEFAITDTDMPLSFTLTPADATAETAVWESSDESIVTVNASGKITARGFGNVTIKATTPAGKEVTTTIAVVEGKLNDIGNVLSIYNLDQNGTGAIQDNKFVVTFTPGGNRSDLLRGGGAYLNVDKYPIFAIRTNAVHPDKIWHNLDTQVDGGANGGINMVWQNRFTAKDGGQVYYVNLAAITYNGSTLQGKGGVKMSRFWIKTGSDTNPRDTYYDLHWVKTFKSMQELQDYVDNE